jgi:hypothetical protein
MPQRHFRTLMDPVPERAAFPVFLRAAVFTRTKHFPERGLHGQPTIAAGHPVTVCSGRRIHLGRPGQARTGAP